MTIELGDEVKHKYTGVRGIAVARTSYLSGCDRISIQQKVKKDGTLIEANNFDEPEIELVKKNRVERKSDTGGWKPQFRNYLKG